MRGTIADFRAGARIADGLRGLVRRLRVSASSGVAWILLGYDDGDSVEEFEAEVFTGAGFASRPSSKGEAIAVRVGAAAGHTVVVATRDPAWATALGELGEGETALFNGTSVVRVLASGEVHASTIGGTAVPLATKADLDALREWLAATAFLVTTAGSATNQTGTATVDPADLPPSAAGTQKLRGE